MISSQNFFIPAGWRDYELLHSGDGMKQERWGDIILIRPEAAALWSRSTIAAWEKWDGWFRITREHPQGSWHWRKKIPASWKINYHDLSFLIRPTTSKQVGLFPEQALNWDWSTKKIKEARAKGHSIKLLNLFGYTGAASIAAAHAGASVCHVDASKMMVAWCAENADLMGNPPLSSHDEARLPIRFIVDDCLKFIMREKRRGHRYDAIILDPPTFGRGTHGEIWKIEERLLELLQACYELLTERPLFLLLNTYSPTISEYEVEKICKQVVAKKNPIALESFQLGLRGSMDNKIIPCGMTTRLEFLAQ